jgi:hypothetical protein
MHGAATQEVIDNRYEDVGDQVCNHCQNNASESANQDELLPGCSKHQKASTPVRDDEQESTNNGQQRCLEQLIHG